MTVFSKRCLHRHDWQCERIWEDGAQFNEFLCSLWRVLYSEPMCFISSSSVYLHSICFLIIMPYRLAHLSILLGFSCQRGYNVQKKFFFDIKCQWRLSRNHNGVSNSSANNTFMDRIDQKWPTCHLGYPKKNGAFSPFPPQADLLVGPSERSLQRISDASEVRSDCTELCTQSEAYASSAVLLTVTLSG